VIDLAGINATSGQFNANYSGGLLTVGDGTHTAQLTFSNFNQSFVFASDGAGMTPQQLHAVFANVVHLH
jgi:hypothetical protein